MSIKRLSEQLANQIAAGEVIERPASVVKELLENALDAKASTIEIHIEGDGTQLICIRDDGMGIDKQALPLTIAPHATSKIFTIDDLFSINTLGFRGEALASISSVSKFSIASCLEHNEDAYCLLVDGKARPQLNPVAHTKGTTVEVRDLFFNTPVRRKFLRSPKTELGHIEDVVKRIALSRFEVSFIMTHNGRLLFHLLPALNEKEKTLRVKKLFGQSFITEAKFFDVSNGSFRIWGWLGSPNYLRSQNDLQYVYINGRMVKDKLLNHAIRVAYEPLLYPGRHATYILFFELAPTALDVNVHPTKYEVRFHEPRQIHDFFSSKISHQLKNNSQQDYAPQIKPHIASKSEIYPVQSTMGTQQAIPKVEEDNSIISLSNDHGLIQYQDKALIFNVKKLYQDWLYSRLVKAKQLGGLKTRPLLVPLTFNMAYLDDLELEKLAQFGLSINRLDPEIVALRGFPVLTPYLDFELFFSEINTVDESTLLKQLAYCSKVSLCQLSKDEKKAMSAWACELKDKGHKQISHLKILASSDWDALIND